MPSGSGAKSLLVLAGLGMVALLVAGAVMGVIGQRILGLGDGYVSKPEIHLPPQPVFPASVRDQSLGLIATEKAGEEHAEEPEKDEAGKEGESTDDAHGEEIHSVPLGLTQFAVTNTLLSSWFTTVVLILFFGLGAWKKRLIPGRFQSLIEGLIEAALGFCSSVLGPEMGRKAFPVAATIFFFVLFNAWLALLPFYQFMGFMLDGEIKTHLLRSAGTDLNFPMALALISFVFVEYWGIRSHGVGYFKKFFALGGLFRLKPYAHTHTQPFSHAAACCCLPSLTTSSSSIPKSQQSSSNSTSVKVRPSASKSGSRGMLTSGIASFSRPSLLRGRGCKISSGQPRPVRTRADLEGS